MKTYKGTYTKLDAPIISRDYRLVDSLMTAALVKNKFEDYETAEIKEYNLLGRNTASYTYSHKTMIFYRWEIRCSYFGSWDEAKQPFKWIAQRIIERIDKREYDTKIKRRNQILKS